MVSTVTFFLPGKAHFQPVNKDHTLNKFLNSIQLPEYETTFSSVHHLNDVPLPVVVRDNLKNFMFNYGTFPPKAAL